MRTTAHSALVVALVLAAGCALPTIHVARGQPTGGSGGSGGGAGTPTTSGRFVATYTNGRLQIEDTTNGYKVIAPNGLSIAEAPGLATSYDFRPADGGCDITITYTNSSAQPRPLGSVYVPGMRLAHAISMLDARHDAKFLDFDSGGGRFTTAGREYPSDLYSPVGVIQDDRYIVGMSLSFPILEYKHALKINYHVPGGSYIQSGFNWNGEFQLTGDLAPGESRQYTLSVRVVERASHWLHTLVPYRDYFQQLYGPVRYQRDPRPILGFFVGMNAAITANNPYGFDGGSRRPDLHGWGPWAEHISSTAPARGYGRVMIWAPSGLYRIHQEMNYPFQFMTGMQRNSLVQSTQSLVRQRTADRNLDLGFWWGRSSMVMSEWDTDQWEPLDPANPQHVQLALAELDLAVQRGADTIGLDAFVYADQWNGYRWLELMRARHPHLKYVIEPSACDFQHVLAPTWVEALHHVETPPILQDFLVPGHETWANTRMDLYYHFKGVVATDLIKNNYWRQLAEMGYNVMSYEVNTTLTSPCLAAEGWLHNIPPELLSDPRTWTSPGALGSLNPDPGSTGSGSGPSSGSGGSNPAGGNSGSGGGSGPGPSGGSLPPPPPPPGGSGSNSTPPPRISTSSISPEAARRALDRANQGPQTLRPSSIVTESVRQRIEERRNERRLSSLTDDQWERRKVRRTRLIQSLGLQALAYQDRLAALRNYRQARAAERASSSTFASHPNAN